MVGRGAFCKKLVPSRVSLFGAPKGALGAVSSRESGTPRIAPGRHFWASLVSRMRKTTFSEAAKTRDMFLAALVRPDWGTPWGARFRITDTLRRSPGRALGPIWGPGGAGNQWQTRKVMIFDDC